MRASIRYGNGLGEVLFDNLMCHGNESSLFDCPRNEIWENNCALDHSEDAGVVCNGKFIIVASASSLSGKTLCKCIH